MYRSDSAGRDVGNCFREKGFHVDWVKNSDLKHTKFRLRNTLEKVLRGDVVVFYFSGHGDGNGGRLWCNDDKKLKGDHIRELVAILPDGVKLLVLLQTCASGDFMKVHHGIYDECLNVRNDLRVAVLAACRKSETSYGFKYYGREMKSVFTKSLLPVLKNLDPDASLL